MATATATAKQDGGSPLSRYLNLIIRSSEFEFQSDSLAKAASPFSSSFSSKIIIIIIIIQLSNKRAQHYTELCCQFALVS